MNNSMLSEATGSQALTMNRNERVKRFGIECLGPGGGDGIFFKAGTWRPGGEYIQKLVIRNVSTEVKKLKYKLPSTRYFSMAYPEPIVLSPGLAQQVDVVFRPVEYEPYDDTIYIKMLDGISGNGFHIPVRATIDNLSLQAPEGLDLGYCATHQITQMNFHLINTGEIDAPYEWEVPEPFQFVPSEGVVPVGKSHEITVSIRPTDASVFVSQAICHVGKGVHAIIPQPIITTRLSAIGKFAYISLSDSMVSFEEVVSGMIPETKEIVLANTSVVPAEFQLIRLDSDRDEVFEIHPKQGVIPPRSEVSVTINYRALAMGCYTHDRYAYRTPGNCNTVLTVKGTAMPPRVSLYKDVVPAKPKPQQSTQSELSLTGGNTMFLEEGAPIFSLNFRDVEVGKVETRLLFLSNDSPRDVPFYVLGDINGIFKMTPKQGIIPAMVKSYPVKVVFVPPKPINYYRRFFVLVGDALPLFYDCLGTGFIRAKGEVKEQRPAPIRHAHVQAYRNRSVQGYGRLNPDELDSLYESHRFSEMVQSFFAQVGRVGTRALSVTQLQRPVTRTGESLRNYVAPAHEFFIQATDSTAKEVTINRLSLDFGYTTFKTTSASKEIVIHNHTNGKVVVQWYIPSIEGLEKPAGSGQGNHHLVKHEVITVDKAEKELAQQQAFSVHPLTCDINPGQSQSFQIQFVPKQSSRNFLSELEAYVYYKNQRTFRLVNDYSLTPPWCLTVNCLGHTFASGQLLAKASFFGGNVLHNKLVFPCSFVGESVYQTVMIRNTSNLPCTFHIDVGWRKAKVDHFSDEPAATGVTDATSGSVFSVKPDVGEIAAESFVLVCIRFTPAQLKKYADLLKLTINGDDGGKLLLEGTGAVPYLIVPDLQEGLVLFPEEIYGITKRSMTSYDSIPRGLLGQIYMKPTCVGLASTRTMTLKNATRLPLRYRVILPLNAENLLTISPVVGVLKGNDDTKLNLTFSPSQIQQYSFHITIQVFPIGGKAKRVLDANQPGPVDAPETLQEFSVTVEASGEMGALIFDPPKTEAEVRLVHTQEEKSIWLENISESDLSYQLYYQESFQPDSVDQKVTILRSEIMPLQALPGGLESGKAKQKKPSSTATMRLSSTNLSMTSRELGRSLVLPVNAEVDFLHSLFCEQFKGIIPARSRLRCVFTYNPVKSGLFEFTVFAQIHALHHQTQQPMMISNDAAALMKVTGSIAFDDLPPLPPTSPEKEESITLTAPNQATLALLPLTAEITARAAFPKLLFEDIRLENNDLPIGNIDYLWERFSLSMLNYDLSIPLTAEEIALNHSSSPDLSKLKVYNMEFTPQVVNSPIQVITLRLRNHGYLKTTFHFHLPNEKQLELENWCDEEDPSEELNRLICIIEELKLFSIEPKHADLLPGESCDLTISYRHSSLKYHGLHNIPVLVRIAQGKQFYLNVKGQTLAAMAKRSSVKFADVKSVGSPASRNTGMMPSEEGGRAKTTAGGGNTLLLANNPADILLVIPNCGTNSYKQNLIRLTPVPLGLSPIMVNGLPLRQGTRKDFAPLQRVEIINVSSYSISYEVILGTHIDKTTDMAPAPSAVGAIGGSSSASAIYPNYIADENYDMNILQCANPTGLIPNNSSIFLDLYFLPLEEKSYEFPFTIKYSIAPANPNPSLTLISSSIEGGGSLSHENSGSLVMKPVMSRGALKVGTSQSNNRVKNSSQRPSRGGGAVGFASNSLDNNQNSTPMVFEYLNATFQAEGYDPRKPRPVPFEEEYIGGRPPAAPVLDFPEKPVALHSDHLNFHMIPQEAIVRRVVVLNNFSTTQTFEFAIDETSCSLCIDGLLSISPLFGRIEPKGKLVLTLTLKAFAQPIIFQAETSLKVMVREMLKTSTKSRGGTRQQLIDRIKSRKVNSVDQHESVVSHITFSRSVQILSTEKGQVVSRLDQLAQIQEEAEQLGLNQTAASNGMDRTGSLSRSNPSLPATANAASDGLGAEKSHNPFEKHMKTAKFTNTISKDGKIIEGNMAKAVKSLRPYGSTSPDPLMMGDYGDGNQQVLQVDRFPSSPTSRQSNRSNGAASNNLGPTASFDSYGSPNSSPSRGGRAGGAFTPATENGRSSRGKLNSEGSVLSRGGVLSSGHSLSSQGNSNAIRYGSSYTLILRLSGEIYSRETIERLHSLCPENKITEYDIQNPFFLVPTYSQKHAFLPLLPRKYYDNEYINEMNAIRTKARVNISFLASRNAEFRFITSAITQSLVSNLLNSLDVEVMLANTIDELNPRPQATISNGTKNSDYLSLRASPKTNPFETADHAPALPYGVYYNEVEARSQRLSVAQRVILELKAAGYFSVSSENGLIVFNNPEDRLTRGDNEQSKDRKAWEAMDEYTALQDEDSYAIDCLDFLDLLRQWLELFASSIEMKAFEDVIAALDMKKPPLSVAPSSNAMNSSIGTLSRGNSFALSASGLSGGASFNLGTSVLTVNGLRVLKIKEFLHKSLPKKCYQILERILPRVSDDRLRQSQNQASLNKSPSKDGISESYDAISLAQSKELNRLDLIQPIYRDETFGQIAHDLLSQVLVNILQSEIRENI